MTRDRKFLISEIGFIAGISVYPYQSCSVWLLFAAAGLFVSLFFVMGEEKARMIALVLFFFICALIRYQAFIDLEPQAMDLEELAGKRVQLECRVAKMPEIRRDKQQVVLEVEGQGPLHGHKILAFVSAYGEYGYGDKVALSGKLLRPENFDDFDYRSYLRSQGIFMVSYYPDIEEAGGRGKGFTASIYAFRRKSSDALNRIMPSPQSGIVSAMILGTRSAETETVMEKFNQTGTSHVIAVSGYHLVVVIAALMFLMLGAGINRGKAFYLAVLGIVLYVLLSGSSASAVRSGIMAFVFLLAEKVGRGKNVWNALIFSATAMVFANPHILRHDIGFQLSFLSTLGLVAILPFFQHRMRALPSCGGIKEIFQMTAAAQLAVLPVLIYNFGRFSLLSFLANVLILPSVPILMGLGFLSVAICPLSLGLARVIAFPAYLLVSYEIGVAECLSGIGWGMWEF